LLSASYLLLYLHYFCQHEDKRGGGWYRQLLSARGQTDRGEIVLPSKVNRENPPASLYERATEDGGSEFTFAGADLMDKFFKRMSIVDITAIKIRAYSSLPKLRS
jgi:hypothetical protein